jgi:hypothetical protein
MSHGQTQITVTLMVVPRRMGQAAGLFGNLDETLGDLRNFKVYAETRLPAGVSRG